MIIVHIRVTDDSEQVLHHIMHKYALKLKNYLIVKHINTKKQHYHTCFYSDVSSTQVISKYLKRNYKGNDQFSIKKGDEKGFQYILHPGHEIIETNIQDDRIQELIEKSQEAVSHAKKLKINSLKTYLIEKFKTEENVYPYHITRAMGDYCIEKGLLLPAKHYGRQLIHTVLAYSKYHRDSYDMYQYLDDYYEER